MEKGKYNILILVVDYIIQGNNILEVKKIVEYIQTNYTFTNQEIFKIFVKDDLCHYFSLTADEVKEVMELI